MNIEFEIYWGNLNKKTQNTLLKLMGDDGNYDVFPIATIPITVSDNTIVQGNALENTTGDLIKSVCWTHYIQYLQRWAIEHASPLNYGMAPPCYDEFIDNEEMNEEMSEEN